MNDKIERKVELKTVLLVDSSLTSRFIIKKHLNLSGRDVSVVEVSDGVEAYSVLSHAKDKIDLVIASVFLQKMSSVTLLKKIRSMKNLSSIPVILMGGGGFEIMKKQLEGCNLAGFMEKPVDYETFLKTAGRFL